MKKVVVLTLVLSCLVGCSQTDVVQPSQTEIHPQQTTSVSQEDDEKLLILAGENLENFLPSPSDFQHPYSETQFQSSNESLVENWGTDYQQILGEVERLDGIGCLYDRESTDAIAPTRILVVIERFASIEGATEFFTYDFPNDFRKGIYKGDSIELDPAEGAILSSINNPNGDDPNALFITITFRYHNINAIVEGQGTVDNVTYEYLKPIALSILGKLENAASNE